MIKHTGQGDQMRIFLQMFTLNFAILLVFISFIQAQEVTTKKSRSWELGGLVQAQHLYNSDVKSNADETSHGFRMRRVRLKTSARLTDWISAKVQFEIRDNSPRLKDAEGKLKLFDHYFIRAGQFKVPVWREELRSSSGLFLIERSAVAEFLVDHLLSARQIGLEFGGVFHDKINLALNYSNGSGEGNRETAGTAKDNETNNGKLYTGRINVTLNNIVEVGISGALNYRGQSLVDTNTRGLVGAVAPDFGVYLPRGVDIEGGFVVGSISKDITGDKDNRQFTLLNVDGRFKQALSQPVANLAGLDAWEAAAGISYIEPNSNADDDEFLVLRFGPAFYFGKNVRMQMNAEIEKPLRETADTIVQLRSQLNVVL